MEDIYTITRAFADSWALLVMFALFIGIILFAFRPGSNKVHADIANIPFRHEDRPAPDSGEEASK
ncbi:CcoQ/FixQ family Cbb3-type cytochrome c oxidase assembly chaperone [Thalassobacter stenotrophicus]|uniref:Cbb3-type cytochrome oxidase, subunit 3 n=2 Tax=Thalassobacter stenotrophicus TaxID=266809 RepID=A0A0P1EVW4_9RHOB|nr:CcoQ/FixQ family Cbb3-type cytochrome c oxidase assembly chaperone [Thalassobacter stenotrophicus]PVZ50001.1 CcoQ/FixQ family Cbb3-type cytochrome c oxidase assembly chaperone [Thalassobacter stenotrophicus]CUH58929.1 Cbb3-type cytochrome oxidase, subunit 3 [Thalassobacter stenotrophicus]SHJ26973.1 cytochrome c oxidase cbb3-type subunit 4 [Thalassobacter stenotrophicus DSM 16310]